MTMRRYFVSGLVAGAVFAACGNANPRPIACGPGPAHASSVTYRHVIEGRPRKRTIFTITNPTGDDVVLDCARSRTRIAACTEADILWDRACDLQNDVTYSPNTEGAQ